MITGEAGSNFRTDFTTRETQDLLLLLESLSQNATVAAAAAGAETARRNVRNSNIQQGQQMLPPPPRGIRGLKNLFFFPETRRQQVNT